MHIYTEGLSKERLEVLIGGGLHADYVYMYPPRQAYRSLENQVQAALPRLVRSSFATSSEINLYIHVPYCRQICSFCNLYSTNNARVDLEDYVAAVLTEARIYSSMLDDTKKVNSLYLGGGTPSLLKAALVERLVEESLNLFAAEGTSRPAEVALEVDPATVDRAILCDFLNAGINRINLGYQSFVRSEVAQLGRRRSQESELELLEQALDVGFKNVCVDLIYGLRSQTDESWVSSLNDVIRIGPPTICAYPLTLRRFTGYSRRGYTAIPSSVLYRRYEVADTMLRASGYAQETHVRWIKPGGGYVQKVNHWGMQNVLGLGAGARSYLWNVDMRNGYSIRSRSSVLDAYMQATQDRTSAVTDGYLMTVDERARKAIMLNLIDLDRRWFTALVGQDPMQLFGQEFEILSELDLCRIGRERIALTPCGLKYRDLIVQGFFSSRVQRLVREFDYDE